MCYIWKNPTHPDYEVGEKTLEKLPNHFNFLNLTGGEPTLREDLLELCDILHSKARQLEISTNGLHPEKLVPIVQKYPDIKIRISIEGIGQVNDIIRGEKNGYEKKVETMKKLIEAGGKDLGFATTFQDENIDQVMVLYEYAKKQNVEFATSAIHNAFQFHKNDNYIYDRLNVAKGVERLITDMLKSWKIKNWFRAYLNLGLMSKILGHDRLHPCSMGTDSLFLDPWSDIYACNVRNDLLMGNLRDQSWEEIYNGAQALKIREQVKACPQNCWMVSSAKSAIRNRHFEQLPKVSVVRWVLYNKLKVLFGRDIAFEQYVNYGDVYHDGNIVKRESFLANPTKKVLQPEQSRHYTQLDNYFNR